MCGPFLFMHACLWALSHTIVSAHVFSADYYFNLHHFSFQNIHSLFPLRYTLFYLYLVSFSFSFPLLCPTPEPISKTLTPAAAVAPAIAKRFKETHTEYLQKALNYHTCSVLSGAESTTLCWSSQEWFKVCVGWQIRDILSKPVEDKYRGRE